MLNKGPVVNHERLNYLNERRHFTSERLERALSRAERACETAAQAAKDVKHMRNHLPLYAVHLQCSTIAGRLNSRRNS